MRRSVYNVSHRLQVGDTVDIKVRRNAGLANELEVVLSVKLEETRA